MNIDNFEIQASSLGVGGQGSVFKGKNRKTGEQVAIKIIDLSNPSNRKAFESEYQVFTAKSKNLQNVVDVLGLFQKENFGFIVMKAYDCDLFAISFEENDSLLPESVVKTLFKKICFGIKNLHHEGIAHLDIKPENILIDRNTMEPYICDFGNAYTSTANTKRRKSNFKIIPALGYRGTRRYSSPEMDESPFSYDPYSADIYSLGITLYILLVGSYPILSKDGSINFNENQYCFSKDCIDLLQSLLNKDPYKRYSIDNILKHPYLTKKKTAFSRVSKFKLTF